MTEPDYIFTGSPRMAKSAREMAHCTECPNVFPRDAQASDSCCSTTCRVARRKRIDAQYHVGPARATP